MTARVVDDPSELVAVFERHRGIHVYGLADLDEPLWSRSTWWRDGDAAVGRLALDDATDAFYAVSPADPVGTLRLLAEVADRLPSGAAGTGEVGCMAVLAAGPGAAPLGTFTRYALPPGGLRPPAGPRAADAAAIDGGVDVVDLGPDDALALADVHGRAGGGVFFRPAMLATGVHVGARSRRDGRLLAAAGTHVASATHRVAAVGAVATDEAVRRRGLGALVTHAVVARLAGRGWTVGLNVAEDNVAARRLYGRLGFVAVHRHEEARVG